jgi:hypothetical protein
VYNEAMITTRKKYKYDDWKKKMLKRGKINSDEFLTDKLDNGKPLANVYLEECPIVLQKI